MWPDLRTILSIKILIGPRLGRMFTAQGHLTEGSVRTEIQPTHSVP